MATTPQPKTLKTTKEVEEAAIKLADSIDYQEASPRWTIGCLLLVAASLYLGAMGRKDTLETTKSLVDAWQETAEKWLESHR